ncbi:MAG TPA: tyrosine-type recombinase/integrase [Terriglobales bacterium]|nr:tyrosine-type recombinase/integrase [Terriglobales bacterium]
MKWLTREEMTRVLDAAKAASERDWLLLLISYQHGLRVSETVALTAANIVDGHLLLQHLKGSKAIIHPLLENEREPLQRLASSTTGRLFLMCRRHALRLFKKYAALAGVPSFKTFHSLRHSCAVHGLKGGMTLPQVQKYLGHRSGASSLIYLEADESESAAAFAKALA